jgi:hypothetical protein
MDRPAHFDVRQARPPVLGILSEQALHAVQQRVEAKLAKAGGLLARCVCTCSKGREGNGCRLV